MFRCPDCTKSNENDNLRITTMVRTTIDVARDESVEDSDQGDLEWDDTDKAECLNCGWHGTVGDMSVAEPDECEATEEVDV